MQSQACGRYSPGPGFFFKKALRPRLRGAKVMGDGAEKPLRVNTVKKIVRKRRKEKYGE